MVSFPLTYVRFRWYEYQRKYQESRMESWIKIVSHTRTKVDCWRARQIKSEGKRECEFEIQRKRDRGGKREWSLIHTTRTIISDSKSDRNEGRARNQTWKNDSRRETCMHIDPICVYASYVRSYIATLRKIKCDSGEARRNRKSIFVHLVREF